MLLHRLGSVLVLLFPVAFGCSPIISESPAEDAADTGGHTIDRCATDPSYSTACWADGVNNGGTQNPSCGAAAQTTLSGVVRIPAGTLPLYNARVYISQTPAPDDPRAPPNLPPILHGATCETCDRVVPVDAVASATTDINGKFTLSRVPVPPDGKAMYLVVRVGKWRRSVRLENSHSVNPGATRISRCMNTELDPNLTRLPRTRSEGELPRIALSTGRADALECLLRSKKLGLLDSEFTTEAGPGSVHLYAGNGTDRFSPALGGAVLTSSQDAPSPSWWDNQNSWNQYDIVMLSCEGAQYLKTKSVTARANLQRYINQGGRVFASHWHNGWIQSGPPPLSTVATFSGPLSSPSLGSINTDLVTSFQKGADLKAWLGAAKALTSKGQLPIKQARNTIVSIATNLTQPWVSYQQPPHELYQYFSFYAPIGATMSSQCGEMVFTDLHVSGGVGDTSTAGTAFPDGCTTTMLSPQEAALIFLIFDLTNCLQIVVG